MRETAIYVARQESQQGEQASKHKKHESSSTEREVTTTNTGGGGDKLGFPTLINISKSSVSVSISEVFLHLSKRRCAIATGIKQLLTQGFTTEAEVKHPKGSTR